MSSIVAQFDPSAATTAEFTAPQGSANGALVFFNESQNSLTLTFADGSNMYLPAWYHRHKCGASGSVNIQWIIHTTLMSGSPPMSLMIVEAFGSGEHFPADGPLVRQTNGSTNSTVAGTSLVNTGNPPGTPDIIEIQPSDAASPTWLADNSGNLTIKGDNAGTLTTLLQLIAGASPAVKLAAAGIIAEVLGGLKVDQTFESAGAATFDSTLTATGQVNANGNIQFPNNTSGLFWLDSVGTAHEVLFVSSGDHTILGGALNGVLLRDGSAVTQLTVTGTSPQVTIANDLKVTGKHIGDSIQNVTTGDTINFLDANGDTMCAMVDNTSANPTVSGNGLFKATKVLFNIGGFKDVNKGSFSASGTYNHGLSGTPTIVLLCPSLSGSTWTFSAYTFTSTQFSATINTAANTNWFAYR